LNLFIIIEIAESKAYTMVDNLLQVIRSITSLPAEEENKLRSILHEQSLKKGDIFIREGSIPQKFAFVNQGLFRYFYLNSSASEFTKGFFAENSFIASYTAMTRGTRSYYTVEALEDSDIVVIDYHKWKLLYNNHPCWSKLLIALLEKGFAKKEKRERQLLLDSAEERYRAFLEEDRHLEFRIKQHLIASYLGCEYG
jgi:CRP-like cAMP-binding protein